MSRATTLLAISICTMVTLFACGDSNPNSSSGAPSPHQWGSEQSDRAPTHFDYAPSCKVANFSENFSTREDHYPDTRLGEGVSFAEGYPYPVFIPFDRPDPVELEFVGELEARAFVVGHDNYGDVLDDGLPYKWDSFSWARDFRRDLHEVVQSEGNLGLPVEGTEDANANDAGFVFFFLAIETSRSRLGELPFDNSTEFSLGLEDVIGQYGLGYVESHTFGGYQVFSVPLEDVSPEATEALTSMVARHTDENHVLDVEGFADEAAETSLPPILYGIPIAQGTRPTDAGVLAGEDLFATMAAVPSRLEQLRNAARDATDPQEDYPDVGAILYSRRVPYTDAQLRSSDMTENDLEKYHCYRDFMVDAYRAEKLAKHGMYRTYCFERRADDASYADLTEPLEDVASDIRSRRSDCRSEVFHGDDRNVCGVCQMPEGASLVDVRELAGSVPGYSDYAAFPETP